MHQFPGFEIFSIFESTVICISSLPFKGSSAVESCCARLSILLSDLHNRDLVEREVDLPIAPASCPPSFFGGGLHVPTHYLEEEEEANAAASCLKESRLSLPAQPPVLLLGGVCRSAVAERAAKIQG